MVEGEDDEILVGEEETVIPVPAPAIPELIPVPPAAVDNWANPTDALGDERNTVYTFF